MRLVDSPEGPTPAGPYSSAVAHGGLLHCAGQVGLDSSRGGLVGGGVAEQAHRALANLALVLQAGGSGLERVLRVGTYLVDLGDFATVNRVFAEVFGDHRPARTTIGVANLPLGAAVEVDCVAWTDLDG